MSSAETIGTDAHRADVVVVGAGPGGAATAAYLADHGLDVVMVEKAAFPRDKICGDGLTPRATKELISLGVDTTGWQRTKGLRIKGGGHTLQLDWPESPAFPGYGMVRTRAQLDEALARHAESRGALLHERTSVTAPVRDGSGRVTGVTAKRLDDAGRATGETVTYRAPVVIASDGVSSRLATSVGRPRRDDRVMGVAVRAYYRTPRRDDYLESHLELWTRDDRGNRILMPGYGWLFPLEDGRTNVGLGTLDTTSAFQKTDFKDVMRRWVADIDADWQLEHDESAGPIRGAALPMGFNRTPLYADGLLLVGDAGGMVNPFNGEGIDYALEAARLGAELVAQAMARPTDAGRERVLARYPAVMKHELGGYFTLGRWFAHAIGNPDVMRLATRYGLPRTTLMRFLLKIMANLPDPAGRGAGDRLMNAVTRIAPSA
ncbi:geranylgeranyl reductase family protein [Terracoccus luteus]|jgi:geranylgeranyl reductase family protein|uniref:Geranylgeranyl reductase family protein n=1 Tax=Terracoccus luteus TaxID=53356 RepID=A0A495XZZ2_9MICO|nr:geranylgeranyl reductase family protein [Terracoccus luteus]RKT78889.1 geranylgeranyl reductase family protein [Terracoccus luteus]